MRCTHCGKKNKDCLVEKMVDIGTVTPMREPCACGCIDGERLVSIHQVADMCVAWGEQCRGDGGRYAT